MRKQRHIDYANCPVEAAFDVIGGKWKAVILFQLSYNTKRFSELQKILFKVTPRMLTKQLRDLEADRLVHREVYAQVPPKVEYSLTELGQSLIPALVVLKDWSVTYIYPQIEDARNAAKSEMSKAD